MSLPSVVVLRAIVRSASSASSLVILRGFEAARLVLDAAAEEPRSLLPSMLLEFTPMGGMMLASILWGASGEHNASSGRSRPIFSAESGNQAAIVAARC